jgi:UDP-glucose:(heptosyl)LPS alpha-1,3-glucosyltransferase
MKIALVKRRYSLKQGGSERYCVNLARRLKTVGHEVTVIGESIDDELREEVEFRSVRVNRLTSWTSNRSFAENCGRMAREGKYDIVYGLGRSFGLDAVRVTERLQSHWVNVYYRHPANRWLQRANPRHRTLIALERDIFRSNGVRRIVTQSTLDRQLLMKYYGVPGEKICTIYNGVNVAAFHPGARKGGLQVRDALGILPGIPLLVFASMDFEGKGLRSIFAAMAASRHSASRLVVLGTGPVRKFRRLASELGLEKRVIFAGRQSEIQRFYGAGDLFLLPTAYEPFPNVNLEAMACGLPVVTTMTNGTGEVITEGCNGYLIPTVDSVAEMTAAIDRHLSLSPAERDRMSAACWETARGMTVEKNVQQTLELFEEVLLEKFRV